MIHDDSLLLDRTLISYLPRSWPVFFERFGRLTPVQRESIPPILAGEDVLICSATASGKTEAVCAPLLERNIDRRRNWNIIYITPTRALVNDLYERLQPSLSGMGLQIARRTGDHRDGNCHAAQIILTTPESFDSLLCRGRLEKGHILAPAVAVVLDEIHLLFGTARGEQVKWLLKRLFHLKKQALQKGWVADDKVQLIGLSATITAPEMVCATFMPAGKVIIVDGKREIELVSPPEVLVNSKNALLTYLHQLKRKEKILVFCNTRRQVDVLAAELARELENLAYKVVAHHGSLSQKLREQGEKTAREAEAVVIVATSTLEIGIDIGDIDLVILDGPAPNVSDLLQRIGRGNRRSGATRVMLCADSEQEAMINAAMLEAARDGYLGNETPGPQFAVARQQIISYLFQARRYCRSRRQVATLFNECMPGDFLDDLIKGMLSEGDLRQDREGLKMGSSWTERMGTGSIHSNIKDSGGCQVIDDITGASIASDVIYNSGKGIKSGGKMLQVKGLDRNRLLVNEKKHEVEEGSWRYASHPWMKGSGQATAVRYHFGLAERQWPVIIKEGISYAFHFGGSRRNLVLDMMARRAGKEIKSTIAVNNEYYIAIKGNCSKKPAWMTAYSAASLRLGIVEQLAKLEYALGRPYVNKKLPLKVRIEEVKGWLKLDEEVAWIRAGQWELELDEMVREKLEGFVQ